MIGFVISVISLTVCLGVGKSRGREGNLVEILILPCLRVLLKNVKGGGWRVTILLHSPPFSQILFSSKLGGNEGEENSHNRICLQNVLIPFPFPSNSQTR